jgi:4-amino-4-deoxy-L-arabinose transferase-like glycosyltransferase
MLVVSALRVGYLASGAIDLSPDEAHYWEWSRRLDLAYYSKGPLVAYLIRLLTALAGDSALAIRLGAVALSAVGSWALYRLGLAAYGAPGPGLLAAIGLQLTPLVWAGSLLMTIDAPFLALWTLTLLALHHGVVGGSRGGWLAAGVLLGLAFLAKYAALFLVPGLLLYGWRAPAARAWLRRPAPWVALLLALAVASPVLVWNARQGWISAQHVASQGRGGGFTLVYLVEFLGSQLGVLSPVVAALLAWGAWYGTREGLVRGREPHRFLMAFAAPTLGFYLLLSLQGKVQANWAAAAYPPLALLTAGALLERGASRAVLAAAGAVALGVTAAGHATGLLGLPPRLDPAVRLVGWRELGERVTAMRASMVRPDQTFLVSDRYQVTSELAFYVAGHPPAYNLNLGRRLNQYDLWEGPDARRGWDALYVQDAARPLDPRVAAAFARLDEPSRVEIRRGGHLLRAFAVYRGYAFRGTPAPTGPVTY